MSNYTDFLPSAYPINSITQKAADTQLFTPNNSSNVWLRQGDLILAGSDYPDANKVKVTTAYVSGNNFGEVADGDAKGICWDGTHWVITGNQSIWKYNTSGSQVGSTIATSGYSGLDITWDGTHYWMLSVNGVVRKYTQAGVYANVTWNTGHAIDNQMYGIAYNSNGNYFHLSGEITDKIWYFEYDGSRGDAAVLQHGLSYDIARPATSKALTYYGGMIYSLSVAGVSTYYYSSGVPNLYQNSGTNVVAAGPYDFANAMSLTASNFTGMAFSDTAAIIIRSSNAYYLNAPDYVGKLKPSMYNFTTSSHTDYVRIK